MIKAIIIDDERNSRDIIALMLEKYCPGITIADTASDCADGIEKIKKHRPNLVFLDLEMPDGTGFDVLSGTLPDIPFEAVFVTAFEKKFLHVIRFSDVELILKPIDKESLLQAVALTSARINAGDPKDRYRVLLENFNNSKPVAWKLLIPATNGEAYTIQFPAIEYLEAQGDNCLFYLNNGTNITAIQSFRYYADLFATLRFYQVNNSQMIQLANVSHLEASSSKVVLKSGVILEITERRQRDLVHKLSHS
ncbi:LytTR family two component transcriptional regulator [Chitinophaga polysaccharea]|uniref:LytTR family two component transcriptional regulator n=1 Tax=Chitinophaga polysaccharea TaxID=1293035 RepID=A0A561Q233_9BACT|nr:response regulator [Chitinophaga polysaccharea]TWF44425.1 LytTR family two component transcriptional regulator [Chitinophaga polysaccharea]